MNEEFQWCVQVAISAVIHIVYACVHINSTVLNIKDLAHMEKPTLLYILLATRNALNVISCYWIQFGDGYVIVLRRTKSGKIKRWCLIIFLNKFLDDAEYFKKNLDDDQKSYCHHLSYLLSKMKILCPRSSHGPLRLGTYKLKYLWYMYKMFEPYFRSQYSGTPSGSTFPSMISRSDAKNPYHNIKTKQRYQNLTKKNRS